MASIVIAGDTSGSVTLQAPAVAGSTVLNLPSTSGTIQTSGAGYTTNGVAYATSTSALSTGSALTFDGTRLNVGGATNTYSGRFITLSDSTNGYAYATDNTVYQYLSAISGGVAIVGTGTNHPYAIAINGSEKARFDTSGNLGLGVTPSAWGSAYKMFQASTGASFGGTGNIAIVGSNYYNDGSSKYIGTGLAALYLQDSGVHKWLTAPSGTAGNAISFTQGMTLDSTSALLINATSNDNVANRLYVQGYQGYASSATNLATSATKASARIRGSNDSSMSTFMGAMASGEGQYLQVANLSGTSSYDFAINPYGGNFMVGKAAVNETSNGFEVLAGAEFRATNSSAPAGRMYRRSANGDTLVFYRDLTAVGSVSVTTTTTTYNTSSDYRLKNITGALTGYKERLMSLLPKQGTWIADGSDFRGFVAHDFANPYPNSVTGEKDAVDADGNPVMQSMQASSSEVMADLVAMIQEQQTLINTLTDRISVLENK